MGEADWPPSLYLRALILQPRCHNGALHTLCAFLMLVLRKSGEDFWPLLRVCHEDKEPVA